MTRGLSKSGRVPQRTDSSLPDAHDKVQRSLQRRWVTWGLSHWQPRMIMLNDPTCFDSLEMSVFRLLRIGAPPSPMPPVEGATVLLLHCDARAYRQLPSSYDCALSQLYFAMPVALILPRFPRYFILLADRQTKMAHGRILPRAVRALWLNAVCETS